MPLNYRDISSGYPVDRKTHLANFTFAGEGYGRETLTRADFPWGYFDGRGVHWTLTDAIGSVEMVVDGKGNVEQHTGYYPYGEPWREPAGQARLFGGKERRRFASLGDYDFHARYLTSATALWQTPDPHAGDYEWLSPYVFCAANPIRNTDPTGMDIFEIDGTGHIIQRIKTEEYDMLRYLAEDFTYVESAQMPAGTIEKQWTVEGNDEQYDYLQVRGDDSGSIIFEFLAEITDVEYVQLQCGEVSDKGLNFITTSHTESKDISGAHLLSSQVLHGYTIRTHVHNHPSGSLNRSKADIDSEMRLNSLYGGDNNIIYKIYAKGKGYKEYEGYRAPNIVVTNK